MYLIVLSRQIALIVGNSLKQMIVKLSKRIFGPRTGPTETGIVVECPLETVLNAVLLAAV